MMRDKLQPCLSGEKLSQQKALQHYMPVLRQLISAPQDIYQDLHLNTLYGLMALCQAISQDITEPEPYPFVQRQLDLTVTALKLRRGKMLPLHADSETIAAQESLWTYALFSASLLWQLDRIQASPHIALYKSQGEQLGTWHPIAGHLAEPNTFYQITARPHPFICDQKIFQSVMVGKIIPTVALRWLTQYPPIFHLWWDVILDQAVSDNPIQMLIHEASKTLGFDAQAITHNQLNNPISQKKSHEDKKQKTTFSTSNQPEKNKTDQKTNIVTALNDWLVAQYKHKDTTDNKTLGEPLYLRVSSGFFIAKTAMADFKTAYHHLFQSPLALEILDGLFEKDTEKDNLIFNYRATDLTNKTRLTGMILLDTYLCDALKAMAIQKDWMLATLF